MNTSMTTYETFRDRVRIALTAAQRPLAWTEIKAITELPQQAAPNQWVRRLETEIGLTRVNSGGATLWQIGDGGTQ